MDEGKPYREPRERVPKLEHRISSLLTVAFKLDMAKKDRARAQPPAGNAKPPAPLVDFPALSLKDGLECTVLLGDQILLIDVCPSQSCTSEAQLTLSVHSEPPVCRGVQALCQVHRRTSLRANPAEEAW